MHTTYGQLSHIAVTVTFCVHVVLIFLYSKLSKGTIWIAHKINTALNTNIINKQIL